MIRIRIISGKIKKNQETHLKRDNNSPMKIIYPPKIRPTIKKRS